MVLEHWSREQLQSWSFHTFFLIYFVHIDSINVLWYWERAKQYKMCLCIAFSAIYFVHTDLINVLWYWERTKQYKVCLFTAFPLFIAHILIWSKFYGTGTARNNKMCVFSLLFRNLLRTYRFDQCFMVLGAHVTINAIFVFSLLFLN